MRINGYSFVDADIKNSDTQNREELDQLIEEFGTAYTEWEGAEMTNPTATRIWFLLKELKELRDANALEGETDV